MTSADATGVCEYLQWDSDFFACRIGRIRQEVLTPDLVVQIGQWAAQNRIDCLYLLADPQHHVTTALAQQHGLSFTDVRLTLVRSCHADEDPSDGPVVVRPASAGDVAVLRALAAANHRDSRFYHDRHFPRASCDALFTAWIDRSCSGYADQVLVSETASEVQGYVTIHLDTANRGRIGLLGVNPAARGMGCGRALVMSALQVLPPPHSRPAQCRDSGTQRACAPLVPAVWLHHLRCTGLVPLVADTAVRAATIRAGLTLSTMAPAFDYSIPFNRPALAGNEREYMAQALASGHISGDGAFTKRCQALLERELGCQRALLTTSCTHALEMAALLLDLEPGDEVIVPSFTFVSTVNAFVLRGARPGVRRHPARHAEPRRDARSSRSSRRGPRRSCPCTTPASAARWTRIGAIAATRGVPRRRGQRPRAVREVPGTVRWARSARSRRRASTRPRTSPAARAARC